MHLKDESLALTTMPRLCIVDPLMCVTRSFPTIDSLELMSAAAFLEATGVEEEAIPRTKTRGSWRRPAVFLAGCTDSCLMTRLFQMTASPIAAATIIHDWPSP